MVFLNDEGVSAPRLHLARRFGRFVEPALFLIFFKTHAESTL